MPAQPKHIRAFEVRLAANWSSEDVLQMLSPEFVGTVLLEGFPALEPTTKMRALIAFLGASTEQLLSLRRHLHSLLRMADDDKDEWVQVVSGLVHRKLISVGNIHTMNDGCSSDGEASDDQDRPRYSAAVLRKTMRDVLARGKKRSIDEIIAERPGSGGGIRFAPYFGPIEEKYSGGEQQQPRGHVPNSHFSARYDFVNAFSEDLSSAWHVNNTPHGSASTTPSAVAATNLRVGQGGSMKPTGGSTSHGVAGGTNPAQARRVKLAANVSSAGSDGLRRISKPIALAQKNTSHQPATGNQGRQLHLGGHKGGAMAAAPRGTRRGAGAANSKMGVMMLNTDEMHALDAEKLSARKVKGKPGRKKARIATDEGHSAATEASGQESGTGAEEEPQSTTINDVDVEMKEEAPEIPPLSVADDPKSPSQTDGPTIPAEGEIEAAAAMIVLGVAGADESTGTYLPSALTTLLANANSLQPEGMQKLENFFQKKTPTGSSEERVKYREETTTGEDGEATRVTSYIRLNYTTWMWDRVHKRKKIK